MAATDCGHIIQMRPNPNVRVPADRKPGQRSWDATDAASPEGFTTSRYGGTCRDTRQRSRQSPPGQRNLIALINNYGSLLQPDTIVGRAEL